MTTASNRVRTLRPACLLATLLLPATLVLARSDPLPPPRVPPAPTTTSWASLLPGPHPVGFRTSIQLDAGRAYRTDFDEGATYGGEGKAPRPVLVNVWYPADATDAPDILSCGSYFDIGSADPQVDRWARALAAYAADVACTEMLDAPVAELDEQAAGVWRRFLELPTRAHRDAAPLDGPFPTVIFHSGAGSSYEDDSVFCEYLASHGYVVLGSAYPRADGSSFGIDASDGSVRDMEFLAAYARSLPFADWEHMAFGGHSAGAQACLRALMRPDCPADAVFLLDTTIDYYSPAIPNFRYLTEPVLEDPSVFTKPMLVMAGHEASFQMCDTMVGADRTYLTFPELGHNEYIAQGVLRLRVQAWLTGARARDADVHRLFADLCDGVRVFLDAELRGERAPFDALCARLASQPLGGREPCVERVPPGETTAPPYELASGRPPTPRQLRQLLDQVGVDGLLQILAEHVDDEPRSPPYTSGMLMGSLLYDLALDERTADAHALHEWLAPQGVDGVGTLRFLAFINTLGGHTERARGLLEVARDIAPEDPETLEQLRKLDEGN